MLSMFLGFPSISVIFTVIVVVLIRPLSDCFDSPRIGPDPIGFPWMFIAFQCMLKIVIECGRPRIKATSPELRQTSPELRQPPRIAVLQIRDFY